MQFGSLRDRSVGASREHDDWLSEWMLYLKKQSAPGGNDLRLACLFSCRSLFLIQLLDLEQG